MDSSRDSSVWRSLAVTFGGGLALGAVGMKLTQTAHRSVEVTSRPEPASLADRLSSMEHRLARMEQTAASPRAPGPVQTAVAAIDQKVFEAIVGAVDARLHEHASQMDRRLADLEARLAVVVQSLHQRDGQAADNGKRLAEMESQFRQEVAALRSPLEQESRQLSASLSRAVAGQAAIQAEVRALRQHSDRIVDAAEKRFADMRNEYRQEVADLRTGMMDAIASQVETRTAQFEERLAPMRAEVLDLRTGMDAIASQVETRTAALEQSLEARIVTAAAAAAAAQFEERLAPVRAEVRQKEKELSELRERLAEGEKSVLDVVTAIGQICLQAADRMSRPSGQPPGAMPAETEVAASYNLVAERKAAGIGAPLAETEVAASASAPERQSKVETLPQSAAGPPLEPTTGILREINRRDSWRIPLVSSFLVATGTGALLLMHYL
jgi:hypothetical protein